MPDRIWPAHEIMRDTVTREEYQETPDSAERQQMDIETTVARLQREARSDRALLARAPEPELDRLIDEAVRSLWGSSRVKAFVPLFAMQRVRETLGFLDEHTESGV
jgi:hypothetical protein